MSCWMIRACRTCSLALGNTERLSFKLNQTCKFIPSCGHHPCVGIRSQADLARRTRISEWRRWSDAKRLAMLPSTAADKKLSRAAARLCTGLVHPHAARPTAHVRAHAAHKHARPTHPQAGAWQPQAARPRRHANAACHALSSSIFLIPFALFSTSKLPIHNSSNGEGGTASAIEGDALACQVRIQTYEIGTISYQSSGFDCGYVCAVCHWRTWKHGRP